MTYAEFPEQAEKASQAEFERLSRLSAVELTSSIGRGNFGDHHQAFAALAASRDVGFAAPLLADQLSRLTSYPVRLCCAHALLSLLPYTGIPVYALADRKHPGNAVYLSDLDILLRRRPPVKRTGRRPAPRRRRKPAAG